jgi:hypothetical protein
MVTIDFVSLRFVNFLLLPFFFLEKKCLECAESYCAGCFAHFHLRGALQRHRCVPLTDSRPNTPQKKKTT